VYGWYDPLVFWNDRKNRVSFPQIYEANKVTLAYLSSSAKEDSNFSVASNTLAAKQRSRLRESQDILEACVLLRRNIHLLKSMRTKCGKAFNNKAESSSILVEIEEANGSASDNEVDSIA